MKLCGFEAGLDQPLFLIAIFFALVAVQFAFMGLIAEVLIRTYHSANRRPTYAVAEKAPAAVD